MGYGCTTTLYYSPYPTALYRCVFRPTSKYATTAGDSLCCANWKKGNRGAESDCQPARRVPACRRTANSWANTRLAGRVHDAARVVLCLPSAASVLSVCVWRPCPLPSLARVLPPQRVGEKQSDTTSCQASPWIPGVNRLGPMSTIGTCH